MFSIEHIINNFRDDMSKRPEPQKRVFMRSYGFSVDMNIPEAVVSLSALYDRNWGAGMSKNTDMRFKKAHAEARDIGLKAVMRFRSDG